MKRPFILAACALMLYGTASAQNNRYEVGGVMMRNDAFTTGDLFSLSQNEFYFGTARSMGMGGAFTSLGADQASMSINPAGLGMYLHSEITITPMVTMARAKTPGTLPFESNSKNRFGIGNMGGVFNIVEGAGSLLSLNLGIGYNRLADYNYSYSLAYEGNNNTSSIADALTVQLEQGLIGINGNGVISQGNRTNWEIDPYFWNGVAGYKTYLLDRNANGIWYPGELGDNATINGGATVKSIGSAGEFQISLGANWNNKLYAGFTLGIQNIYQRKDFYYGEEYLYGDGNGYNTGTPAVDSNGNSLRGNVMQSMGMSQTTIVSGMGVNFKAGVVYRPFEGLRIGAAIHIPTFYFLDRKYQTAMSTYSIGATSDTDDRPHEYTSDATSDVLLDNGPNSWRFSSPARMLLGASYTFGGLAVISVDYERSWYNGIRVQNAPYMDYGQSAADFKQDFKNYFKGSNTIRAGVEIRPAAGFALRAGFGYNGSMLRNEHTILSSPATYKTTYYTAGVGFLLSPSAFLDIAYCYRTDHMTPYMLFYGNVYNDTYGDEIYQSEVYSTKINRHNIAVTLGFRF